VQRAQRRDKKAVRRTLRRANAKSTEKNQFRRLRRDVDKTGKTEKKAGSSTTKTVRRGARRENRKLDRFGRTQGRQQRRKARDIRKKEKETARSTKNALRRGSRRQQSVSDRIISTVRTALRRFRNSGKGGKKGGKRATRRAAERKQLVADIVAGVRAAIGKK